jgi:hypothetical protein
MGALLSKAAEESNRDRPSRLTDSAADEDSAGLTLQVSTIAPKQSKDQLDTSSRSRGRGMLSIHLSFARFLASMFH